jgi:hypothetical protein
VLSVDLPCPPLREKSPFLFAITLAQIAHFIRGSSTMK